MNNKGFAITTIIFGVLILFCLLLFSMLGILSTYRSNLNSLINNHNGARGLVTDAYEGFSKDFEYNGNYQSFTVPVAGYYMIEAWGAQGGTVSAGIGGKGGYSSGYIYLNEGEKLYIYVGENVTSYADKISFNGGGRGSVATSSQGTMGANGGGATDIRYFGSETPSTDDLAWNSTKGLNSRIMVAAGGGGGTHWIDDTYASVGGSGGGLVGTSGSQKTTGGSTNNSSGGTQTVGGTQANSSNNIAGLNGSFGQGGSSDTYTAGYVYQSGGGGGYYGGGAGNADDSVVGSASGGSSFISGFAGVNAIDANRVHTNNTLHYSSKYFINNTMTSDVNASNGKAKITYVGRTPKRVNTKLDNVRYVRDCMNASSHGSANHWVEFQVIKNGVNIAKGKTVTGLTNNTNKPLTRITDGDITSANYAEGSPATGNQCITIDLGSIQNIDEIAVWHYWADARTYYNNVTSVSSDNSTWTTVINYSAPESVNGKRVNAWNQ